jgi:hypothetical protein
MAVVFYWRQLAAFVHLAHFAGATMMFPVGRLPIAFEALVLMDQFYQKWGYLVLNFEKSLQALDLEVERWEL